MSNPWPERSIIGGDDIERGSKAFYESDTAYLIRMVQQLFVEIAQVKAMLEKYHFNVQPHGIDDRFTDALK